MKVKINGQFLDFFNEISIDTSLDAVASTFAFTCRFDPENIWHKKAFRPLSYPKIEFFTDDDRIISTGTIVKHEFASKQTPELLKCSGYSLGGVLEDCQTPYSLYPLESNNRTLKEIAERLLSYFGLKLVVYDIVSKECNEIIKKSVATPEDSISSYLSKVAAQKNVIMSHDVHGNIIFFRPDTAGKPKAFFNADNTMDMDIDYNGQGMHSIITNLRQPSTKKSTGLFDEESESTSTVSLADSIKNTLVIANRPKVEILTSGTTTDTDKGVKNSLAAELKNITLSFGFKTLEPYSIGDIIEVQNPELFLYNRTRWLISGTTITEDQTGNTLNIKCVLPESFTGEAPQNFLA